MKEGQPGISEDDSRVSEAVASGIRGNKFVGHNTVIIDHDARRHISPVEGRRLFVSDPRLEEIDPRPLAEIVAANFPADHLFPQEIVDIIRATAESLDEMQDLTFHQRRRLFMYTIWEHDPDKLEMAGTWVNVNREQSARVPGEVMV